MSELLSGTVTFLFSDIEGSTRLVRELRDGYGDVLSLHRRLVREAAAAAGGREVDTHGDAFFFVFPRGREAVAAAAACQRSHAEQEWPHGAEVRVRIGMHTGEPSVGEEGYHGVDVVRAARICSAGHGGQVLLSETTRALLRGDEPPGVRVRDLGEHVLKGLDEPERLFQLEIDGLRSDFPELKTERPRAVGPPPAPVSGSEIAAQVEQALARHLSPLAVLDRFADLGLDPEQAARPAQGLELARTSGLGIRGGIAIGLGTAAFVLVLLVVVLYLLLS